MKKLTLLLVATFFAGISSAQVKNVAVVETEIDMQSGTAAKLSRTDVRQITTELRREAVKNLPRDRYNIMTTETVMAQGSAKLEECAEENCIITLGSQIGADYIVRGTIRKTRTRFRLSVDIYETENGFLITSSEAVSSENIEELIDKAAAACAEMYKTFANPQNSTSRSEPKPPVTHTITVTANPANGGAVSRNPNQTYYTFGMKTNLMVTPATGYEFVGWSGDTTSAQNILTVTMNGDKTLTANFRYIQKTYKLTTNMSPLYGGNITRSPDKEAYVAGEEVTVTATPATGYSFIGWTGAVSGSSRVNRVKVTMDGDKILTAGFYRKLELEPKPEPEPAAQVPTIGGDKTRKVSARRTYTLTTNLSPSNGGFVYRSPNKEAYSAGEKIIVTCLPASGYAFTDWTLNNWNDTGWTSETLSENPVVTITMDRHKALTANFQFKQISPNGIAMIYVAGGTFTIGCTSEQEKDCYKDEKPAHSVTLDSYYIGKYEVTQGLWKAVMGSLPLISSKYDRWGDNYPVYGVSWGDVQMFISKLNSTTGKTYRLPTEAEWEYAARGGNKSEGYKYSGSNTLGSVAWYRAWYSGNSSGQPHEVGMKAPNELGIYDMSGNVWEWVSDWFGDYSSFPSTNPTGPTIGYSRVFRGGSWDNSERYCRVSIRNNYNIGGRSSTIGFRLVLSSP